MNSTLKDENNSLYENAFSRLLTLFPYYDLLNRFQNEAVIAGGSVVYALLESVPKSTVGDIDVWVNDKDTFRSLLKELDKLAPTFHVFDHESEEDSPITLITSSFPYNAISVQLILTESTDPIKVVKTFDMDYVQCAMHKGNVHRTDMCKEAHDTMTVTYISNDTHMYRLKKANAKGFRTPLFITDIRKWDKSTNNLVEISYDELQNREINLNTTYREHSKDNPFGWNCPELLFKVAPVIKKIKKCKGLHIPNPKHRTNRFLTLDKIQFNVGNAETYYLFFRATVEQDTETNNLKLTEVPKQLENVDFCLQKKLQYFTGQTVEDIVGDNIVCAWFYMNGGYKTGVSGKICGAVPYNDRYILTELRDSIDFSNMMVRWFLRKKIEEVMHKHKKWLDNNPSDSISRCKLKHEAYKYFLERMEDGMNLKKAILQTRMRTNGEMYKHGFIRDEDGGLFMLLSLTERNDTVDSMIKFIEDFPN